MTLFSTAGNVVRAAFTMGRPKERKALIELIHAQKPLPSLEVLADPAHPLGG